MSTESLFKFESGKGGSVRVSGILQLAGNGEIQSMLDIDTGRILMAWDAEKEDDGGPFVMLTGAEADPVILLQSILCSVMAALLRGHDELCTLNQIRMVVHGAGATIFGDDYPALLDELAELDQRLMRDIEGEEWRGE